jgi:uncharacterized protein (TIGR00369 family)
VNGEPRILMDAEELVEFMSQHFPGPWTWPIERVDPDGLTVRRPTSEADLRPGGTISGPTLMTMADSAAYMVILSRIGPAALAVTTNLTVNFLRRAPLADLVAEARILKLGRTLATTEVLIHSDDPTMRGGGPLDTGRPVAQATVTYSMALVEEGADQPHAETN